jgi:hypothetical protein
MNLKRDNWLTFVAALAVTVAVLVAGQLLWQKFAVARPLDAGLRGIAGVTAAGWEEGRNGDLTINVTLGTVDNLAKTYGEIGEKARTVLGRRPARIVLADSRTPELESLAFALNIPVQEAIKTGNFTAMAERVAAAARDGGADARVSVDAANVYIQLTRQGAALYEVVPRPDATREVK